MPAKYEMIYKDLCEKISEKFYKNGELLPTEKELANSYNVSRITIQKAMQILSSNGLIERVPGKGTFLKTSNSPLRTQQNKFISAIIPKSTPETITLVYSLQKYAASLGYNLTIHFIEKDGTDVVNTCEKAIKDGSSGIVILPADSEKDKEYFRNLQKKIPMVTVDKAINHVVANSVFSDNFTGTYELTEFLINNNHKKIAFFCFDENSSSLLQRTQGFLDALNDYGLPIENSIIKVDHMRNVSKKLSEFFNSPASSDVSALIFCTDEMSIEAYRWLTVNGKKIPNDISIAGFDDSAYSRNFFPELTTVHQDFGKIGEEAGKLLFDIIEKSSEKHTVIYIPTKLIVRKSVKSQ